MGSLFPPGRRRPTAATPAGSYQVRDPLDIATIAAAAALGGCYGLLWWNAHPGRISQGSSGSFTLGGLIAGLSILSRTELLAVVIGALVVAEAISVAVQVVGYRTGKIRIFTTAPLHQHFQLRGWTATTVMVRFWILAAISAAAGAVLFYTDWLSRTGGRKLCRPDHHRLNPCHAIRTGGGERTVDGTPRTWSHRLFTHRLRRRRPIC